jgi:hypothetical protein
MKRWITATVIIGLSIVVLFAQSGAANKGSIEGVWQLVERTDDSGKNPTPDATAIRIFTRKHFTWFQMNQKRPAISSLANATDAEKLAFLTTSNVRIGTYEIKGNELTCHPSMSNAPLRPDSLDVYDIKIDGDTLLLKQTRDANGPRIGSAAKYKRVE